MTLFISHKPESIVFRARAESPGAIGDLVVEIKPGESYLGRTYAEWRALDPGPYEVA